tara:strand:- start:430 stop:1722 length:1293 start_codon:yes stop_codon:yes gene_type:complete
MNFHKSEKLLKKAKELIPSASQTFSKSYQQYPIGKSPVFLSRGKGGIVWDVDNNKFIDLVCGLLPIVIGYNNKEINSAIIKQLKKGITFSLSTELEIILSKMLNEIIPSAEMVRFGKTGSDVTGAAIRIARAYTKKEHIISIGYHGWHDWYIGATTRDIGVPKSVKKLTHKIQYNNTEDLEKILHKYKNKVAAIIMEPMNIDEPKPGYLNYVKKIARKEKALLIFDEIVTGFRFDLGGAQNYFNVTPDISTFGKALGNGMPIAAIVGKKKYMNLMDEIFFSGTFNGECLSIAAAIELIKKIKRDNVIKEIWSKGEKLTNSVNHIIKKLEMSDILKLKGKNCWKILKFENYKNVNSSIISTFFHKEMIAQGILINGSHNICYEHTSADIKKIVKAYEKSLKKIKQELNENSIFKNLDCPVMNPVFKPRKEK